MLLFGSRPSFDLIFALPGGGQRGVRLKIHQMRVWVSFDPFGSPPAIMCVDPMIQNSGYPDIKSVVERA